MKPKKSNSKCVRMTDEVLAYVEKQPGDGFNQKFESIILDYMYSESNRKKRVAYYDNLINTRKKQLTEVAENAESLDDLLNLMIKQVDMFRVEVNKMKRELTRFEAPEDA